jgi:hypothetical protein
MEQDNLVASPPEPPDIERRLKFYPLQWIGLPILIAVPVLALFGVLGESWSTLRGTTSSLEISVRYPTRFRYKQLNEVHVFVKNVSGQRLDTVTVSFDSTYISRFSTVTFLPAATRPYEVEMTEVLPGEDRLVVVELQGEQYWRHEGKLRVSGGEGDTASFPLSTIIFP